MNTPSRPPGQRWIKRPPRPSRPMAPKPAMRERPGTHQLLTALGFAIATGIVGAIVGPLLIPRAGMGGMFAGLGFAAGFLTLWRAFGGTVGDLRDIFR